MSDRYSKYDDHGPGGRQDPVDRSRDEQNFRRQARESRDERSNDDTRGWAEGERATPDRYREQRGWSNQDRFSGRERAFGDQSYDRDRQWRDRPDRSDQRSGYPDIGPQTSRHTGDTDYSGMSFGGGHRTDDHVYAGGTGLEAGYMARPTAEYRRPDWNGDDARDMYRTPASDSDRFARARDRHAWWQERHDAGPHVGRGPRGYQRSDERIREDLNDRLTAHGYIDATDIECQVVNGEVTLSGFVSSRQAKHEAEDVASDIPGVRDVHNQLRLRTNTVEEGVGRTSVLGLTEAETQNAAAARDSRASERPRSRG
jgi:hypothetical protein